MLYVTYTERYIKSALCNRMQYFIIQLYLILVTSGQR